MKLYGSQTSPYVRRIRLLLAQAPHEFINLNIFADADRQTLASINPTLRIPMLEDDEKIIFDSGVIYRYLAPQLQI
ncbi:MAG: glutathione S-transferase family protein, partial [Rheinheimera sp.]|nr:glutathione S-transferase family protein [Rheinheimera sp.]